MIVSNLQDIKGIGPKRHEKITTIMQERRLSLVDVFAMSPEDIKKTFSLPINVAKAILEVHSDAIESLPEIKSVQKVENSNSEFQVLEKSDPKYPRQVLSILGQKAPEKLYVWGNLELLQKPAVGFCGSRNVSEKGLEVTADIAKQVAKEGWVVVSGHARGVDTIAHRTALENNAGTIIVLPQGMDGFKLRAELKRIAKKENLLIISEFPRNAGWAVGRAMQRNRTIIGLSNAMVLVESRLEGGTFNAGKDTLRYKQPLFVIQYSSTEESNAGNQYFIQRGAKQLFKSKTTEQANIKPLKDVVENQHDSNNRTKKPSQLSLFEGEKL